MNLILNDISIERITGDQINELYSLLQHRRFGNRNTDKKMEVDIKLFSEKHQFLNSNNYFIYVAKYYENYIGYINAILMPKFDFRLGILFIDELWVDEKYRNNKVAEKLMNQVIQKAKDLNLYSLRLYVSSSNQIGRKFYEKMGYLEKENSLFCEIDLAK